jgi:hypothetical protein
LVQAAEKLLEQLEQQRLQEFLGRIEVHNVPGAGTFLRISDQ